MSAPCFGWALDQGRERKLPTAERFVLVVLSNRANPARLCWPSLPTIAADTGLSARTVFAAVHSLAAKGLIEIKRFGRRMEYRILRPNGQERPTSAPQSSQPVQESKVNGHKLSTDLSTDPVEIVQDLRSSQPVQGSEGADSCKSCIAIIANGESAETPETRSSLPVSEDLASPQTTKKENLERKQVAHAALEGKQARQASKAADAREREPTFAEIQAQRRAYAAELGDRSDPISLALRQMGKGISAKDLQPQKPGQTFNDQRDAMSTKRVKPAHLSAEMLAVLRQGRRMPAFAGASP